MRISTNQMYDRGLNSLLNQELKASKLNQQLSSQLRVESPSDDPIASAQIELLAQRMSATRLLQKNRDNAEGALTIEEGILSNTVTALQRLREIQVQASGALSYEDRQALALEAKNLLNQLTDYANTKDGNDNYMFSGGQTLTPPIALNASGQYVYNGDNTQRFQAVSSNLQIAINDTGDDVFMRIPDGNGDFKITSPATPNNGTAALSTGSIADSASYVPDNYTLSFALNTQGNLVVMVTGIASGNVIPATGSPDDAPLYTDGMSISFNGMDVPVTGMPQAGDSFNISPSQNESVFSTVQRMINNLNKPYVSAVEKAATYTENNQLLTQLDSALLNILDHQSDLGARLNQLDFVDDVNTNLLEVSDDALKKLKNIDPAAAASEYNIQLVNLQAAQQSFLRIQGLSLFNYL